MMNERGIAFRYLRAQKKRSILLIFGVILSVALVSAIFSMLNILQLYEETYTSANGDWYVAAKNCTPQQAQQLEGRVDVTASGRKVSVHGAVIFEGKMGGSLVGCDAGGANHSNNHIESGKLPQAGNEIALEKWALGKIKPGAAVGSSLSVKLKDGTEKTYVVSGILKDVMSNRSSGIISGVTSLAEAERLAGTDRVTVLMQVANSVNIESFTKSIIRDQHIDKDSVGTHDSYLIAIGRSRSDNAMHIYTVGGFLALLVLIAAIVMIYNSFNISVAQRVKQFGLLRALGSTPKQIRKVVHSEALLVSALGVIPGLILGFLATNILLLFLRIMMPDFFTFDGIGVYVSWISLVIGAVVGVLTTLISSHLPAKRAGRISPVEAIASVNTKTIRKRTAKGAMMKIIPVESALSLRQLTLHKKSFILTSLSLSFGVLLLLTFNPLNEMIRAGTDHNFDFGDVSVASAKQSKGFTDSFINSLAKTEGVATIYAKRIAEVSATFKSSELGSDYRDSVKDKTGQTAKTDRDGMVVAPSKSVLIGLSDDDLRNLNSKLVFGKIDPNQINDENGVILALNYKGLVNINDLRPGDFITVNAKKVKICGVIKSDEIMFAYNSPFIGMFTTQKTLQSVAPTEPNLISMTLKSGADADTVFSKVKQLVGSDKDIRLINQADAQSMAKKIILVADVFIYGFIAVIALIGILNIINTMSTNILVRTREIGLLRAGGMTMGQISAMVASEAAFYAIVGLIVGLAAGIPLDRWMFNLMIKKIYGLPWTMPWNLVVISSVIMLAAVVCSIISPLKHIKQIDITEAVTVE